MDATLAIWLEQSEELQRDLERVAHLLGSSPLIKRSELDGKLGRGLSLLFGDLDALRRRAKDSLRPEHWRDLATMRRRVRAAAAAQLEILGGISLADEQRPLDGGIAARAAQWLKELKDQAGIDGALVVVSGYGPLLDAESGLVRLPILDWDGFVLPRLGRAIGLLAASAADAYRDALDAAIAPAMQRIMALDEHDPLADVPLLLPELAGLARDLGRAAAAPADLRDRRAAAAGRQRRCYEYFFADVITTALVGPPYALAVFSLELDYRNPNDNEPEDPFLTKGERKRARPVAPTAAQRAAAILLTLRLMNADDSRPAYQEGPYARVCGELEALWRDAEDARGDDSLQREILRLEPLVGRIYAGAVARLMRLSLDRTALRWQQAQQIAGAMAGDAPPTWQPDLTAVLGAMWLCQLRFRGEQRQIRTLANLIVDGRRVSVPLSGATYELSALTVATVRHQHLEARRRKLEEILRPLLDDPKRSVIAGRFFRLLSAQSYDLEDCEMRLRSVVDGKMRPGVWKPLSDAADREIPLVREALEFLGGARVQADAQDCEPPKIARIGEKGPSICALADRLLGDLAKITGVSWSAQTIPGGDPFLTTATEVIRVRFAGWSPSELTVMAHEMGHLVAQATPAFRDYQARLPAIEAGQPAEVEQLDDYLSLRRSQCEELFADLFATYTCGPAFACSAVYQQFNPAEAFDWRRTHPTHQERALSIFGLLDWMGRRECERPGANRLASPFTEVLEPLKEHWGAALAAAGAAPSDSFAARMATTERWGRQIAALLDRHYRLGAAFTPERWRQAMELAPRLLDPGYLSRIRSAGRPEPGTIADLPVTLNALWWARLTAPEQAESVRQAAYLLGLAYLEATS